MCPVAHLILPRVFDSRNCSHGEHFCETPTALRHYSRTPGQSRSRARTPVLANAGPSVRPRSEDSLREQWRYCVITRRPALIGCLIAGLAGCIGVLAWVANRPSVDARSPSVAVVADRQDKAEPTKGSTSVVPDDPPRVVVPTGVLVPASADQSSSADATTPARPLASLAPPTPPARASTLMGTGPLPVRGSVRPRCPHCGPAQCRAPRRSAGLRQPAP